jgi:hypothetical protein
MVSTLIGCSSFSRIEGFTMVSLIDNGTGSDQRRESVIQSKCPSPQPSAMPQGTGIQLNLSIRPEGEGSVDCESAISESFTNVDLFG